MINNKEQIIEYFKSGIKNSKDFKIELNTKNFYSITKIIKELIIQK